MLWKGVAGQDKTVTFLENAVKNGNTDRGFLLVGPEGSGKRFLAFKFSQAINCLNGDGSPCGGCLSCRKIEESLHPDINWVLTEAKSDEIKIDQIRELARRISYKTFEGRKKISIVIDAERMNEESANCLLKTLEEPPNDSVIVLTTSNLEALLPTVVSRCRVLKLSRMEFSELKDVLVKDFEVDEKESELFSRLSEGWLGRALRWKDKENMDEREKMFKDFCSGKIQLTGLKDYEDKASLGKLVDLLIAYYRDLLVFNVTKNNSLLMNIDKEAEIRKSAPLKTKEFILDKLKFIMEFRGQLKLPLNCKLAITYLAANLYE